MAELSVALPKILKFEGGYSNDPDDPGGETFMGVSRKFNPDAAIWPLLDAQPDKYAIGLLNDPNLYNAVYEVYEKRYWEKLRADEIHEQRVATALFDFAVLAGVGVATALTQSLLNVKTDGNVGPITLAAINSEAPDDLLIALTLARIAYLKTKVEANPKLSKYFYGWTRRALEHIEP